MGTRSETLQSRLQEAGDRVGDGDRPVPLADPVAWFRRLENSGRFHRDGVLGRIYHRGSISLRENVAADSLHVVVTGDHIAAHVDRVSPLGVRPDHSTGYSLQRAALHNLVGAAQDFVRLLRGRQGDHRSHLDCAWLWDGHDAGPDPADLLDPRTSAWSLHLEATVEGTLDEMRLRKALGAVLGQRPATHDPLSMVDCADDDALGAARDRLMSEPAGVGDWPPLRAVVARHPDGDVLLLNVNHSACDGPGALRLLQAVAAAYVEGAATGPPLDLLAAGDLPVRPASAPVGVVASWYRQGVEWLRDWLARPARLAPDDPGAEPNHGFHLVSLSVADTRRVMNVYRPGTARNVLLAGLHLAIGDWNLAHGTPGRRIGVLIPVDLRPPDWRDEVVGNFSVTARVSTSRRHRAGQRSALKAVRAQKDRNKRARTGVALLAALERNGLLRLWAKQSLIVLQPLTLNRELDTAVLANLGWLDDPPSFGPQAGATTDVWFSSPARTSKCLCVGAVAVAGRLHLTFRYPSDLFSPDAARRFADCYVDHIVSVAERRW